MTPSPVLSPGNFPIAGRLLVSHALFVLAAADVIAIARANPAADAVGVARPKPTYAAAPTLAPRSNPLAMPRTSLRRTVWPLKYLVEAI